MSKTAAKSAKPGVFQFIDVPRRMPRELPVNMRVLGWNEIYGQFDAPAAVEQSARCLDCGNPYCSWKCPVHNDIPNWLALVRKTGWMERDRMSGKGKVVVGMCGGVDSSVAALLLKQQG